LKCYRRAAEKGSLSAMNSVALMSETSDENEAMNWYKKAH